MVDVEKMSGKYEPTSPIGQFSRTAGRFAGDLLELTELQAKLAKADAKEVLASSAGSVICAIIGCCLLLASIPVLLFGLASAVSWCFGIDVWIAQLSIGAGVALLSILLIALATRRLLRLNNAFQRSVKELKENFDWIKKVFRGMS